MLRGFTFTAFCVVLAILFVVTVAAEVLIEDSIRPRSTFMYLLISTLITGLLASMLMEKLNVQLLE